MIQQPLKVKSKHRRVRSNAADNSLAVVGLGQINRQVQNKGNKGQANSKNALTAIASAKARPHNPRDALNAPMNAVQAMNE